jgi:D-arabinose 1-dehydrogenase-like Zn-dependent alcohol dehydrogenase
MITDKLERFQRADAILPEKNVLWPLYGAGFGNLGKDGQPIEVPMPSYGPDELLVRHDAVGLCFSDIKVIWQGEAHPRIYRDMRANPVTLGHEVTMTVVGVGENLKKEYHVGDRFIIQADIFVDGAGYAYGYEIQGGLSQYGVVDQRILNGDDGNYLIPVQPSTGYAESALTEPWACVIAAYQLTYRTALKADGTTWIIGPRPSPDRYTIGTGFDESMHPARLLLTGVPTGFEQWLTKRAAALGIEVLTVDDLTAPPVTPVDDIVLLGADPDVVEMVSPHLGHFGILAFIACEPMPRKVAVDVGQIHYSRWLYVGGTGPDIAQAYAGIPVRSTLKPGGQAWFVGAGGPLGHMHVQRAIQAHDSPATIVCTDVSELRLDDLCSRLGTEAEAQGIEWVCLNPMDSEAYAAGISRFRAQGFDDIIVLAPIPALISDAATYLAPRGVMNIFAGIGRDTAAQLDLSDTYQKNTRVIGHSGSTIDDLRLTLHQAEAGQLSVNRSVAAIGSLGAARDGLQAVQDSTFPGKIVLYPSIKEMPLTAVRDLKDKLPTVHARLKNGWEWTVEAEQEFLRLMLP